VKNTGLIICFLLALVAAVFYFLMGAKIITVPTLETGSDFSGITFIAGGGYVLGALLLVLVRRRWMWGIGLVINALVILMFFSMYNQKPEIMFSLPGLGTKICQILLEIGIIYLIATYKRRTQATA
jgi:hypothetical protein